MKDAEGYRRLLTDRLDIRAVDMSDLDALHRITADPRNSVYVPGGVQESPEVTRAWIERFSAGWSASGLDYWTVRLRVTGAVIGVGGVRRRPGFWNLFYLLDRDHWGCGYATELARAAQRAATTLDPDLPLAAWIHEDNIASQAVARRLGLGLKDYGRREADHWKGAPMRYWADREPERGTA